MSVFLRVFLVSVAVFWSVPGYAADPMLAAGRIEDPGSTAACSASLVAPDIVLTAAHCVAARRANGLGMRVIATRNSSREGPEFVEYVGLSDELFALAEQADP